MIDITVVRVTSEKKEVYQFYVANGFDRNDLNKINKNNTIPHAAK